LKVEFDIVRQFVGETKWVSVATMEGEAGQDGGKDFFVRRHNCEKRNKSIG
jgi:hypothetical protein